MFQVKELAGLSGVSVRTLHHYDKIGLLHPTKVTQAGYRLYDDQAVARLERILFLRELKFPLKEIARMLDAQPDPQRMLSAQRELLVMERERITALIDLVDGRLKGENAMNFDAFDTTKIDKTKEAYAQEAKQRWGDTDAYRQSAKRTSGYTKEQLAQISAQGDAIFAAFSQCMRKGDAASSPSAQALVARWQAHITQHFYTCTSEILAGLGLMYANDERFAQNIDRNGEGTARYMADAIAFYTAQ